MEGSTRSSREKLCRNAALASPAAAFVWTSVSAQLCTSASEPASWGRKVITFAVDDEPSVSASRPPATLIRMLDSGSSTVSPAGWSPAWYSSENVASSFSTRAQYRRLARLAPSSSALSRPCLTTCRNWRFPVVCCIQCSSKRLAKSAYAIFRMKTVIFPPEPGGPTLMPLATRSATAPAMMNGSVRTSSCETGPPSMATTSIVLVPLVCAAACMAVFTFVMYLTNHWLPATDFGFAQSTGPVTSLPDRCLHEHARLWQQSGTLRLGLLSAASAVELPAQSYPV